MNEQRPAFHSIPLRTRRPAPAQQMTTEAHTIHTPLPKQSHVSRAVKPDDGTGYPLEEDESYYDAHPHIPRSARVYTTVDHGRQIIQQGNRRVIVKHVKAKPRIHWLFPAGLGMLAMLALVLSGMWAVNAWDTHQLDSKYGFPRTWQTDQAVGHNHDSLLHKTHFTFENLNGHIFFVEFPAGDISKARVYDVFTLLGDDKANWPVTAEFKDVNGDGRIDILIHIQDQTIVYLNDGTGFKP